MLPANLHWGHGPLFLSPPHSEIPAPCSAARGEPYPRPLFLLSGEDSAEFREPRFLRLADCRARFGKAEWLQPYTAPSLEAMAKAGVKRVDILCPGFVADCLETLEEIAMEGKADFLAAGGREYHYIPALNEQPLWIAALTDIVEQQLQGWPTRSHPDPAALETGARLAAGLGAKA